MKSVRLHPRVYDDIDEALAQTREQFGPRQVVLYARLISKARQILRRHPTIGQLRDDLGPGIRVYCIAAGRIKAPHGYVYRVHEDGPFTSRASFILRGMSLTYHKGDSEEQQAGEAELRSSRCTIGSARKSDATTQKPHDAPAIRAKAGRAVARLISKGRRTLKNGTRPLAN